MASLALAGCSSFSSPFSSSNSSPNQTASVPPPNYVAAPGQPGYAPYSGQQAYAAQQPPPEAGSVGSLKQSYVNFLQAFRDTPEQDASASPPARPPANYAASQQPYATPPGQPGYAQPAAQQNYAPPTGQSGYPSRSGQQSYAAPAAQPAYAAPAAGATAAATPDASDSMPYPKQSVMDLFRDSTAPQNQATAQNQAVPRPPSTYTPSGQPYSPGAVAAAPPPPADPADSMPYPKQSLSDVFSSK